jgi:hypothetical protein
MRPNHDLMSSSNLSRGSSINAITMTGSDGVRLSNRVPKVALAVGVNTADHWLSAGI